MIIEYEGQRHEFDYADIGVKQAMKIEKHTGLSFFEWGQAVAERRDMRALQAVGWLILHGGDLDVPIEDCDFKVVRLGAAIAKAQAAEEAAEKAAQDGQPGPTAGDSTAPPAARNGEAADLSPLSSPAG